MKYAVDKIEENIVTLENIETGELIIIDDINILPIGVKEKDILRYENNEYKKDELSKEERIKIIREKMNLLKNEKK